MTCRWFWVLGLGLMLVVSAVVQADAPIDGQWDPNFGGQGVGSVTFALTDPVTDAAVGVARAPSGRLYVAASIGASVQGATTKRIGLSRFLSNGELDLGFSGDGQSVPLTVLDVGFEVVPQAITVQADGKPLVLARRQAQNQPLAHKIQVCRYAVAGNLDSSFDGDGCALPVLGVLENSIESPRALELLPDGSMVVLVSLRDHPIDTASFAGAVYKLTPTGERDSSFGAGSGFVMVKPPICTTCSYAGMTVAPDGSVFLYGSNNEAINFVSKVTPQGEIDNNFGVGGHALFSFANLHQLPNTRQRTRSIQLDSQGRIYTCGHIDYDLNLNKNVITIARLDANGQLDPAFDGDGRLLRPLIDVLETSAVEACDVDASDRLMIAIRVGSNVPRNGDYAALRLLPSGEPDLRFNLIGYTRKAIDLGGPGIGNDLLAGMVPDAGGIVLVGTSLAENADVSANRKITLVRFGDDRLLHDGFE